jgi:hypothetical protein
MLLVADYMQLVQRITYKRAIKVFGDLGGHAIRTVKYADYFCALSKE